MTKSIIIISLFYIFLIFVVYAKCYAQTGQEKKNDQDTFLNGEQIVGKYGCLVCHKTHGPKVGPAFNGVGIKYRKEFAEKAADSIAFYIKQGSKGKYPCSITKDAAMPPFNIPEEERMAIANWIVNLRPMKDMYRKQVELGE